MRQWFLTFPGRWPLQKSVSWNFQLKFQSLKSAERRTSIEIQAHYGLVKLKKKTNFNNANGKPTNSFNRSFVKSINPIWTEEKYADLK